MDRVVSISVSTPYLVEVIYRRIVGELRSLGKEVEVHVEGNTISLPLIEGVVEAVWRVIKTSPSAVFTSIDIK
ncbi:hypothetical protein [Pyrobaculum aerophilum]|uniref:Thiamine-binding protein domain-containing protein n=1 Tax=Pyrobaculum aerophilum TaxID=13773 RepID=A0A371QV03_9CREN|nr:hypothetical protein [Pyrobaculum aerophilum]RFA93554.1 hypothetical protein CGL51_12400 [Pyrobaculum aerophilum]RFA97749.1 hypothetical protein CGL52_08325 [Pyrobaculum aerophilum]